MNAESDFSTFNLEYLLRVRDLTLRDSETAAITLGVSPQFCQLITEIDTSSLIEIVRIKRPLVIPFNEPWWWQRLFVAIRDGRRDEADLILEHASIITPAGGVK